MFLLSEATLIIIFQIEPIARNPWAFLVPFPA